MKLPLTEVMAQTQQPPERITAICILSRGITDFSALHACSNLRELDLSDNNISELSALCGLRNLRRVVLEKNQISSLAVFSSVDQEGRSIFAIENLSLKQNRISELQQLRNLAKIPTLRTVNLLCNEIVEDELFFQYALAMLPNATMLNEETIRDSEGNLIDIDKFIDALPGEIDKVSEEQVDPWLPESAFQLAELPGFNDICIELEQAVRSSIEQFYEQQTKDEQ